ncbi:hypothetical protein PINS_up017153, partial [Pythium insidiosum]
MAPTIVTAVLFCSSHFGIWSRQSPSLSPQYGLGKLACSRHTIHNSAHSASLGGVNRLLRAPHASNHSEISIDFEYVPSTTLTAIPMSTFHEG